MTIDDWKKPAYVVIHNYALRALLIEQPDDIDFSWLAENYKAIISEIIYFNYFHLTLNIKTQDISAAWGVNRPAKEIVSNHVKSLLSNSYTNGLYYVSSLNEGLKASYYGN